jgi:hypothetical protein
MDRLRLRRLGGVVFLAGLLVAGLLAAGAVSAKSTSAGAQRSSAVTGAVHVRFNLQRFQVDRVHKRLVAHGNVVATYRSGGRVLATTTKKTTLKVAQATSCRVLHLELGELRLQLLGLIVSLTPTTDPSIVLDISANGDEALGKLFCQVLQAVQGTTTTTTSATKAARKLSSVMATRYRSSGVMSLDVPLRTNTAAATTTGTTSTTTTTTAAGPAPGQCEVLDLVLGPLNLDLLGLVVQLNQVELNVSANPVGTLGTLFCQLAGGPTTSTATTTTAGTTT